MDDKSMTYSDAIMARHGIPAAGTISEGRRKSAEDIPRLRSLPIQEQLADRGDAMKIVPLFALDVMSDALEEIKRLALTDVQRQAIEAGVKALRPRPTWRPDMVETVCADADKHVAVLLRMLDSKNGCK